MWASSARSSHCMSHRAGRPLSQFTTGTARSTLAYPLLEIPHMNPAPFWLAAEYPADQRAAVDYLRSLVDVSMLRDIAAADYAKDFEQHLEALEGIWNGAALEQMHHWVPMEVLELSRWITPDDEDDLKARRDHTIRAFCCAVLLATPNFETDRETLILLFTSMQFLGGPAMEALVKFLTWKLSALSVEDDHHFFVLAIVAGVMEHQPDLPVDRESDLAQWFDEAECGARNYLSRHAAHYQHAPWPIRLTAHGPHEEGWWSLLLTLAVDESPGPLGRLITEKLSVSSTS